MPPEIDAPTLARYLVGDLSPDEMEAVQVWLEQNPEIRRRLFGAADESGEAPEWDKKAALRRIRELDDDEFR